MTLETSVNSLGAMRATPAFDTGTEEGAAHAERDFNPHWPERGGPCWLRRVVGATEGLRERRERDGTDRGQAPLRDDPQAPDARCDLDGRPRRDRGRGETAPERRSPLPH